MTFVFILSRVVCGFMYILSNFMSVILSTHFMYSSDNVQLCLVTAVDVSKLRMLVMAVV
jgi:hypothetical protein